MSQRHRWKAGISALDHAQFCTVCGMLKKQVYVYYPGVNPARQRYWIWQYSKNNGKSWFLVRSRQRVPECPGVYLFAVEKGEKT